MVRPAWFWLILAACGNDVATENGGFDVDAQVADLSPSLPCEVRAIVEAACAHCHSAPTSADAPMSLLSRADFLKPSSIDGVTVGELSLDRLRELPSPMPPRSEPPLAEAHRAVLESWFAAGMPVGTCDSLPAKPLITTCASGSSWSDGNDGDVNMNPGKVCRDCHVTQSSDDAYFFSGTVFDSFHGRDLCNTPPPSSARIEILDMQPEGERQLPFSVDDRWCLATVSRAPRRQRAHARDAEPADVGRLQQLSHRARRAYRRR